MNGKTIRCHKCLRYTEPGLVVGSFQFCEACFFICFNCGRTLPSSEISGKIHNDPACYECVNPRYYE